MQTQNRQRGICRKARSPQRPDNKLFLFEAMSLCKWRSYFNFIESCAIRAAATWSQHKKTPSDSKINLSFGDKICHPNTGSIYQAKN